MASTWKKHGQKIQHKEASTPRFEVLVPLNFAAVRKLVREHINDPLSMGYCKEGICEGVEHLIDPARRLPSQANPAKDWWIIHHHTNSVPFFR